MLRKIQKYLKYIIGSVLLIAILNSPYRHAAWYDYIPMEDVLDECLSVYDNEGLMKNCSYENILKHNKEIEISQIYANHTYELPLIGGEYIPKCSPAIKSAIIVPYRDRENQLKIFLNYMHSFLQNQSIHYRIFIVEQHNDLPFNRAKLMNYGGLIAGKYEFNCLILHDVDLIPLNSGNIYSCSRKPRHMCSALDTFRFNLPYTGLSGGALSIQMDHFTQINGLSNSYDGWGGEDDDLYRRLDADGLAPYRFPPEISRYTMLKHKKCTPSEDRLDKLAESLSRQSEDGISSLAMNYNIEMERLFTHIIVN